MVELVVLQSLSYMAGAIGVCIAALYYVMNLRVQQKNMKATLQTREAQLFSNIYQQYTTKEMGKAYWTVGEMKFNDLNDWEELKKDVEKRAEWGLVIDYLDGVGVFVGEGLIDIKLVAKLMGGSTMSTWENLEKGIKAMREEYGFPRIAYDTEYLYNRLKEYEKEHPEELFGSPSTETFKTST